MTIQDPLRLVGVVLAHKYAIESVVRVEAATVVYRATHRGTNRSFAVRILTGLTSLDDNARRELYESLIRDQACLADVAELAPAAHPVRDVGTVDTPHGAWLPYVVLAWPHGLTLEQAVAAQGSAFPSSVEQAVALLEPVAVALAIAHENGVVHGAITADHILLREEGDARVASLLDFGVARALKVAEGVTVSQTADVRGLAGVLAQVVARALEADGAGPPDRTPRQRGAPVDEDLEATFARALSLAPFISVGDFWSAIRRALALAPLRAMEATLPPEHPSSTSASRSLRPMSRSNPPPPPRGAKTSAASRAAYVVAAAALVVVGVVTARRTSTATAVTDATGCGANAYGVAAGTYRIGVDGDADDPSHAVALSGACVDRDAVSTSDYKACSDRGDCKRASRTNEWDGIDPTEHDTLDPLCRIREPETNAARAINCVTYEMAATYCATRGARLPTEAEWEVASRATGAGIAEWVGDWRAPVAADGPQVDPRGPGQGDERVVRGPHAPGAPPTRFGAEPSTRSHAIGFRCARSR